MVIDSILNVHVVVVVRRWLHLLFLVMCGCCCGITRGNGCIIVVIAVRCRLLILLIVLLQLLLIDLLVPTERLIELLLLCRVQLLPSLAQFSLDERRVICVEFVLNVLPLTVTVAIVACAGIFRCIGILLGGSLSLSLL